MDAWVIALLVCFVGALVTFAVQRHNAYRAASTKLRGTFTSTLADVYPLPVRWPGNVDAFPRNAFPPLQAAAAAFRPHLPWYKRRGFDQAWFEYLCSTGREINVQCSHPYIALARQPQPTQMLRVNI